MTPLMWAWLAGCAMRHTVRYEPLAYALEQPDPDFLPQIPAVLRADLAAGRLTGIAAPELGGELSTDALDDAPPEALYALYSLVRPWTRGAELDVVVDLGEGPRPVTLRFDLDRHVEVTWGDEPPSLDSLTPPIDPDARWIAEWGIVEVSHTDRAWTPPELVEVDVALRLLTPEEREALRGLELVRAAVSPRLAEREYAFYDPRLHPPELVFFDKTFSQDTVAFVGPADAPLPSAFLSILHEVGHALADLPARDAYLSYVDAETRWLRTGAPEDADARRTAWRETRRAQRQAPVVAAWQHFRDGRLGPTSFGFRNPHESFAEAFALWHCDPDALERALPGAGAWFASGAHVQAAGLR